MQWYNEPPFWNDQEDIITVTSGAKTDFWRITHLNIKSVWVVVLPRHLVSANHLRTA